MRDLERDLRDLFERRADEAVAGAPHRMPAEVHRRIRRRVARTAVVGVAAIAALAGTVAGISRLGWVGGSDNSQPAAPGTGVQEFVVASGETAGNPWRLVAIRKPNEWCLEFRLTEPVNGICEGSYSWKERWAIGTGYAGDPTVDGFVLYGAAPRDVRAIFYEFEEGGRTQITLDTAAELPGDPSFNPFHAELPPRAGIIAAYSEDEQTPVFRQLFAPVPPPGPPPMSELTPVADHFGNVWGQVRTDELFAPPPPPGTTRPSAAWSPPGLEASVEVIREVAQTPVALVWTEVGDWWAHRPGAAARPNDAVRAWWDSYPVDANLGLALGETFYREDSSGHVWAGVGHDDAVTLRHAAPGEGGRTADYLRIVAATNVPYIAPETWTWWTSRPPADAPDSAFLEWWDSYSSA